jgi:hypothetical protein
MNDATISSARINLAELRRDVIAPALWTLAILAWGVGDLATTWAGYQTMHAVEATPFVDTVIERWGHAGHAGVKALAFGLAWIYYQRLPVVAAAHLDVDEDRVRGVCLAIPLAFVLAGGWLTLTNLDAIL